MKRPFHPFTWRVATMLAVASVGIPPGLVCGGVTRPARHLFLDPAFVLEVKGVAPHVNPPPRREVVIQPDKPWEELMISFHRLPRETLQLPV